MLSRLKGPPPPLEGPLAVNTRLQKGRRLFAGQLRGPESFTADEEGEQQVQASLPRVRSIYLRLSGNVYTGTVDGKLWRIAPDDRLTFITQMGQKLPECGWWNVSVLHP